MCGAWWGNALYALGVLLVAFVTWWEARRVETDAAYRAGHRDGWSAYHDKQLRERESAVARSLRGLGVKPRQRGESS